MPNILLIVDQLFPSQHAFLEEVYVKNFPKRGYRIFWIFRSAEFTLKFRKTSWHNSTVYLVPREDRMLTVLRPVVKAAVLTTVFIVALTKGIRLIQVRDWIWGGYCAVVCKLILRIPFVFQRSFPMEEAKVVAGTGKDGKRSLLLHVRYAVRSQALKAVMKSADLVFPISRYMKDEMVLQGYNGENMVPVPMGFSSDWIPDEKEVSRLRDRLNPGRCRVVLYIGTLSQLREPEFMVRVHKEVVKKVPRAVLIVVGGTKEENDWLRSYAAGSEPSRIMLVGQVSRAMVPNYISLADVCISPIPQLSIFEVSSPTKLIEYMALGKPVVASRIPDQKIVLEESGGGFCVEFKENEFANAIASLLKNKRLRKTMGEKGRKYVYSHRSYDHISSLIENAYKSKSLI